VVDRADEPERQGLGVGVRGEAPDLLFGLEVGEEGVLDRLHSLCSVRGGPPQAGGDGRLGLHEGDHRQAARAWDGERGVGQVVGQGAFARARGELGRALGGEADAVEDELFGSMLAGEHDTARLLDELVERAGADPTTDFRKLMSREETTRYWATLDTVDPPNPHSSPQTARREYPELKSEFFRQPLAPQALAALLETLVEGRIDGQSRELDFTPWGEAYNRTSEDATAFAHRRELFSLKHSVIIDPTCSKSARDAGRRWLVTSWSTVRPWGSGRVFPSFPDPDLENWGSAYYGADYERLLRIKRAYDPDNCFRFHQALSTAG
jgi:hypothetical protein